MGEKREERQRPQLPECGKRPSQAKLSPLSPQDLPPKARPGLAPRPPRHPSPTHILTRERGARPETEAQSTFRPGPHYIYPSNLPPSSFRYQTRPPRLTYCLIPRAFPTKLLTLPAPSLTASADDEPSGSAPPPGPLFQVQMDEREVSGYKSLLISFRTLSD